jgi:hypothetical protein
MRTKQTTQYCYSPYQSSSGQIDSECRIISGGKLNIEGDKLAEEVYSSSTFFYQVPMIPGVSAQLLIDGKNHPIQAQGYSPRCQVNDGHQASNSGTDRNDGPGFR